jgi:hypothetical protein
MMGLWWCSKAAEACEGWDSLGSRRGISWGCSSDDGCRHINW